MLGIASDPLTPTGSRLADLRRMLAQKFPVVEHKPGGVLRTEQHLFMYNASGHGAWEASLTNLLSPGDTILVLESGYFSDEWAAMARGHGLDVQVVAADWRLGGGHRQRIRRARIQSGGGSWDRLLYPNPPPQGVVGAV